MSDTKVFRIWIKATPEKIWEAITDPEWNSRYGYAAPQFFELKKGGKYHSTASSEMKEYAAANGFSIPDVVVDGEVLEAEPPRRLVQTWRMLMDPTTAAEPGSCARPPARPPWRPARAAPSARRRRGAWPWPRSSARRAGRW